MSGSRIPNRRHQIITEGSRLFADSGFNGTSIRDIAKACGITEAAIYRHFDNKVNLYEEVIREKAGQHDIKGDLEKEATGGDIESVLTRIAEYVLSFATDDPELLRLMLNNSRENDPAAAVLFQEVRLPLIEFLDGEISTRIEAGEVRPVNPVITARCFVGMVVDCALSIGIWSSLDHESIPSSDVIRNNVPIFARGLTG